MKRFIRKLFSKVTLVILICILAILTFFFWGWIEKQALKVAMIENVNNYQTIYDLRNENQECEYFIVETEDGFIIDGQLYEKVEGFEAYE